jgi:hypothetical protein
LESGTAARVEVGVLGVDGGFRIDVSHAVSLDARPEVLRALR